MNQHGGYFLSSVINDRLRAGEFIYEDDAYNTFVQDYILSNSAFSTISYSSGFGYVLQATLNAGTPSPFLKLNILLPGCHPDDIRDPRPDNPCFQEVRVFVVKIVFTATARFDYNDGGNDKQCETVPRFTAEFNIQRDLNNQFNYNSLIPFIVGTKPLFRNGSDGRPVRDYIDFFIDGGANDRYEGRTNPMLLDAYTRSRTAGSNGIGIIVMEHATGYSTLFRIEQSALVTATQKRTARTASRMCLVWLAVMKRQFHRDHHSSNFLISLTERGQFMNDSASPDLADFLPICVKMIDYGFTVPVASYMPANHMYLVDPGPRNALSDRASMLLLLRIIKQTVQNLDWLTNFPYVGGIKTFQRQPVHPVYRWVIDVPGEDNDTILNDLFESIKYNANVSTFISPFLQTSFPGFDKNMTTHNFHRLVFHAADGGKRKGKGKGTRRGRKNRSRSRTHSVTRDRLL